METEVLGPLGNTDNRRLFRFPALPGGAGRQTCDLCGYVYVLHCLTQRERGQETESSHLLVRSLDARNVVGAQGMGAGNSILSPSWVPGIQ